MSIIRISPLGFPWQTLDPFLFCVHHNDKYPAGNEQMGPATSLAGRDIGQDFSGKDGWSMYHGRVVPGFPQHPHRGFETVTVARAGFIDHSDSLGGAGRYGNGDVQWMTAGKGILHAEMFPLLRRDAPNHTELFQIWLNLPAVDKFVEPHYTMFWNEHVPRIDEGEGVTIAVVAGALGGVQPPAPPPHSWASRPAAGVAIWTLRLASRARFVLPAADPGMNRMLYFFSGEGLRAAGMEIPPRHAVQLAADAEAELLATGTSDVEVLILQGRPIGEPVMQYGPFVMNTREEIRQAYDDYTRTQFGGWPWPEDDHTHGPESGRFARYTDGSTEYPD